MQALQQTGTQPSLDKKIVAALAANGSTSEDALVSLMNEIAETIAEASATIESETERALDLSNDDPDSSLATVQSLKTKITRWTNAYQRLGIKLEEHRNNEMVKIWHAKCDDVERERNILAGKWRETYVPFAKKLIQLYNEIDQCDARIDNLNRNRPRGVQRYIYETELVARGIESFDGVQVRLRQNSGCPHYLAVAISLIRSIGPMSSWRQCCKRKQDNWPENMN